METPQSKAWRESYRLSVKKDFTLIMLVNTK
jgi:hypothetical protein